MRYLQSKELLLLFQVGYLLFFPHPATEYSTVYTAMRNFVCFAGHLDQTLFPAFCGEGVFRIILDIFLRCPVEFKSLLPMLGGIYMAKCVEHCIGKFVSGCISEGVRLDSVVLENINTLCTVMVNKKADESKEQYKIVPKQF